MIQKLRKNRKIKEESIEVYARRTKLLVRKSYPECARVPNVKIIDKLEVDNFLNGLSEEVKARVELRKPENLEIAIEKLF